MRVILKYTHNIRSKYTGDHIKPIALRAYTIHFIAMDGMDENLTQYSQIADRHSGCSGLLQHDGCRGTGCRSVVERPRVSSTTKVREHHTVVLVSVSTPEKDITQE